MKKKKKKEKKKLAKVVPLPRGTAQTYSFTTSRLKKCSNKPISGRMCLPVL